VILEITVTIAGVTEGSTKSQYLGPMYVPSFISSVYHLPACQHRNPKKDAKSFWGKDPLEAGPKKSLPPGIEPGSRAKSVIR
jgi:hypothetical protein